MKLKLNVFGHSSLPRMNIKMGRQLPTSMDQQMQSTVDVTYNVVSNDLKIGSTSSVIGLIFKTLVVRYHLSEMHII